MNNGNESSADMSAASSKGAAKAKTPKASADTKSPKVTERDKTLETPLYALLIGIKIAICLISCRMVAAIEA